MNTPHDLCNRRQFAKSALLAGSAMTLGSALLSVGQTPPAKRIRTGVIGCGSVSNSYLPVLTRSPFIEVVSLCDIRPERAQRQAERFKVAHHHPNLDAMLGGVPFDFLVNLTDLQEHAR